jgi:hypothetical protein
MLEARAALSPVERAGAEPPPTTEFPSIISNCKAESVVRFSRSRSAKRRRAPHQFRRSGRQHPENGNFRRKVSLAKSFERRFERGVNQFIDAQRAVKRMFSDFRHSRRPTINPDCTPPSSLSPLKVTTSAPAAIDSGNNRLVRQAVFRSNRTSRPNRHLRKAKFRSLRAQFGKFG